MQKEIKKISYEGIDLVKILMAIIVIAIHTEFYSGRNPLIKTTYDLICSCAVPFFFLTSGFFLYSEKNQDDKLLERLKKIIKLYVFWSVIYFPIAVYSYYIVGMPILKAVFHYVRGFLIIGQNYLSWHLWYLLSFIYSLILLILLRKMKLNDKKILLFSFLTYVLSIIINVLVNNYGNLAISHLLMLVIGSGRLLTGPFLIFCGMYIKKYNFSIKKISAFILAISCFIISIMIPNDISKILLYISIFLISIQICNLKLNTIYLRKSSTVFYFLHMWNLFIYLLIVGEDSAYGVYSFITNIIVCIVEFIIIIFIQKKYNIKIINELFSWPNFTN